MRDAQQLKVLLCLLGLACTPRTSETPDESARVVEASTSPCERPPARTFAPGSSIIIKDASPYPCQIEFHETGVVLSADAEGKVANIRGSIARDSRGRYFTSSGRGEVKVWSPEGAVIRTIGREGDGPGEFPQGLLLLSVDPADNLYVFDSGFRWSIFSPEFKFLRFEPGEGSGVTESGRAFVAPATLLTTEVPSNYPGRNAFHVIDFSGKVPVTDRSARRFGMPPVIRSFGTLSPAVLSRPAGERLRSVNEPVNGAFWSGPVPLAGSGYTLERWTLAGKVERTIHRQVSWFLPGSDSAASRSNTTRAEGAVEPRPPTAIVLVRHDAHGLLFVVVSVTNHKWDGSLMDNGSNQAQAVAMMAASLELYFEVIDTDAGVVLASSGPFLREEAERLIPAGWLKGWDAYRIGEGPDGLPRATMMELRLVKRP